MQTHAFSGLLSRLNKRHPTSNVFFVMCKISQQTSDQVFSDAPPIYLDIDPDPARSFCSIF